MRFATYEERGREGVRRAGAVDGEVIHPLPEGVTVRELLERGSCTARAPKRWP